MRVAVLQLNCNDSLEQNWSQVKGLCESVNDQGVDYFFLPENSLYMRLNDEDDFQGFNLKEPIWQEVGGFARHSKAGFVLGSVPLESSDGKTTNSMVLVDAQGQVSRLYDKIHLFDIELEGEELIRESDYTQFGEQIRLIQLGNWKVGCSICYDLRFSELYREYVQKGAEVLLVPSAFLVPTGEAHWQTLLRARAIENQCYVIAPAQGGKHRSVKGVGKRSTYGHSLVVDPWGLVQQLPHDRPGVLVYDLSKESLKKVSQRIPMAQHRQMRRWVPES